MKALIIVGLIAITLGGCGKGAEEATKAQEDFTKKACACKDMECVKKVQKEQETWVAANGTAFVGATEDQQTRAKVAGEKMMECLTKLVKKKK